jgi:hypothetical protein
MVVAMFLGMAVLWLPATAALDLAGMSSSELQNDAPALLLLVMAFTMTAPMVAWMRYRGHGWAASKEMAASMMLPSLGVVALLATGLVEETGTLLAVQHVVMFPAMLVVMLLRVDEYTHAHARH